MAGADFWNERRSIEGIGGPAPLSDVLYLCRPKDRRVYSMNSPARHLSANERADHRDTLFAAWRLVFENCSRVSNANKMKGIFW
jgi:hypothetical protein